MYFFEDILMSSLTGQPPQEAWILPHYDRPSHSCRAPLMLSFAESDVRTTLTKGDTFMTQMIPKIDAKSTFCLGTAFGRRFFSITVAETAHFITTPSLLSFQ